MTETRKDRFSESSNRLGESLKQARLTAGLTQQEVCDRGGLHKAVVSRIELGEIKDPGFWTIAALARTYGVSLDAMARLTTFPEARYTIAVDDPDVANALRQLLKAVKH